TCAISSSASSRAVSLTAASRLAASARASRTLIEARQAFRLILGDEGAQQFVELALQNLGEAMQGQVDPMVGHPPLREIICADSLRAVARADHRFARTGALRSQPLALQLVEAGTEHLQGLGLVLVLRLLVLLDDDEPGGQVGD